VHSPFVFDLLTKCIYNKETKSGFQIIESYRKALLNDHRSIHVKDFGAGSRVFKSDERKVSAIAKNAGISRKRAFLLNKLTSYLNIESALELGTSVGISSAAIAAGNKVHLTTLEGCPETAGIAREYFDRFKLGNVELMVGSFESPPTPKGGENAATSSLQKEKGALEHYIDSFGNAPPRPAGTPPTEGIGNQQTEKPKPKTERTIPDHHSNSRETTSENPEPKTENRNPKTETQPTTDNHQQTTDNRQPTTDNRQPPTDLIYFDGNHQKQATLDYFHRLLPLAHNDSVFIFDDIHWSKGMEEAWEEIRAHPKVRVSIDSFFWGMVFFRKEQKKEHFTIRM